MSDIATIFDPVTGTFDWAIENGQLVMDNGISTAVLLSWFTDRRALPGDVLPDEQPGPFGLNHKRGGDRRGSWIDFMTPAAVNILPGQSYPEPSDRWGSYFWLFKRRKLTAELVGEVQAEGYRCLKWMIDQGIALSMTMTAQKVGLQTILVQGQIQLASGVPVAFLLPVIVGGGSLPLPAGGSGSDNGLLGVFVLDRDTLS